MNPTQPRTCRPICGRVARRAFLADMGFGFTGMALGAMLHNAGIARAASPPVALGQPHFTPRAKSVIWIFLSGGYSHLETFDPKPMLNKFAGKTFKDTPFPNPLDSAVDEKRSRSVVATVRDRYTIIMPLQVGYRKHGQSGIEMTDWWPHLGTCVDDMTFVRSMYTTDNDHAAENQIHTGRHKLDERQPSIGAWTSYGLGTLNENLPQFAVLGGPTRPDTRESIDSYYLGPTHAGVPLNLGGDTPLAYAKKPADLSTQAQANEFDLIRRLNTAAAIEYPDDEKLRARIKSYELAYRMQMAVPEALSLSKESPETQSLYGIDNPTTKIAGERCLAARRLVERGVRFVQVFPTSYGTWDSHKTLKKLHAQRCSEVDKPVAGLLKDLKRRGLLDDTIVVFCTEFGRTPGIEQRGGGTDGRDHHPHGFTIWLAGAGLKKGYVHGATDELGYHAIEPAHYVTDLHATVLHLLGLHNRRLEIPGHKRLDIDHGTPIFDIMA